MWSFLKICQINLLEENFFLLFSFNPANQIAILFWGFLIVDFNHLDWLKTLKLNFFSSRIIFLRIVIDSQNKVTFIFLHKQFLDQIKCTELVLELSRSQPLILQFRHLNNYLQLTVNKRIVDDWIRSVDLWCPEQLFRQLCHNHCSLIRESL